MEKRSGCEIRCVGFFPMGVPAEAPMVAEAGERLRNMIRPAFTACNATLAFYTYSYGEAVKIETDSKEEIQKVRDLEEAVDERWRRLMNWGTGELSSDPQTLLKRKGILLHELNSIILRHGIAQAKEAS